MGRALQVTATPIHQADKAAWNDHYGCIVKPYVVCGAMRHIDRCGTGSYRLSQKSDLRCIRLYRNHHESEEALAGIATAHRLITSSRIIFFDHFGEQNIGASNDRNLY